VASVFFFSAKAKFIPRIQLDKSLRWDYDYIELGDPDTSLSEFDEYYIPARSDDEWTVGESSSIASGDASRERSPSVASGENDVLWAPKEEDR